MEKNFEVIDGVQSAHIGLSELGVTICVGDDTDWDNNGVIRFSKEKFQEFVAEVNNAWYELQVADSPAWKTLQELRNE